MTKAQVPPFAQSRFTHSPLIFGGGIRKVAGGAPDATIAFTDSSVEGVDGTTITFTDQSFGAATASDNIIVTIASRATDPRTIVSVTVDGQAATQAAFIDHAPDTNDNFAAIYIAPATGNASGTIQIVWSASVLRTGVGVFVATGLESTVPTDTATDSGATLSVGLDISAGGIAVAVVFSVSAGEWIGLTERFDEVIESGWTHAGASEAFASAQIGLTISNNISQTNSAFAAASFR